MMRSFRDASGYDVLSAQIAAIAGGDPATRRELQSAVAFWSIGCAPGVLLERTITANNCHSRKDPLPIRWKRIARAYRRLRHGGHLVTDSKPGAFAEALAARTLVGGRF